MGRRGVMKKGGGPGRGRGRLTAARAAGLLHRAAGAFDGGRLRSSRRRGTPVPPFSLRRAHPAGRPAWPPAARGSRCIRWRASASSLAWAGLFSQPRRPLAFLKAEFLLGDRGLRALLPVQRRPRGGRQRRSMGQGTARTWASGGGRSGIMHPPAGVGPAVNILSGRPRAGRGQHEQGTICSNSKLHQDKAFAAKRH